jgi:hypothetical protein
VSTSLGEWIEQFDDVVSHLSDGPEASAAEELEAVIQRFTQIEATVESANRRRPWLATWRALDDAVAATKQLVETYLNLLVAESVLEAQRQAPALQDALDAAAVAASELSEKLERFNALPDIGPDGDDLVALAASAFASTGASDLIDFDRKGAELALQITGNNKDVPTGMGLALAMKRVAVEAVLDEIRFFQVAGAAGLSIRVE